MSDPIRTPTVPPAQSTVAQTSATPNATLVQLPEGQSQFQTGQSLVGTVVGNSGNGKINIQIPSGQLVLQTQLNFSPGTELTILVTAGGSTAQIQLQPQTQQRQGKIAIAPLTKRPADTTPLNVSGLIAQGNEITAQVIAAPATAAVKGSTTTGRTNMPMTVASAPSPTLPAGSTVTLQITSIAPPGMEFAETSAGTLAINGTTTGTTIDGKPIIQTPYGTLTLETRNHIPLGTRLSLELVGKPRIAPNVLLQSISLTGQWQTLQDAIHFLRHTNSAVTKTPGQFIPLPGPQLTASLLFFISAITSGDIRKMVGKETSKVLKKNNDLFKRLQEDAKQLQRLAAKNPVKEWRNYLIPLLTQTGLEQIKLSVREEKVDEDKETNDPSTHFIVEVVLRSMGRTQFEGHASKKSVRLLMRSQNLIPEQVQQIIQRIYINTLSALGVTGTLAFQQTTEFNTAPLEEAEPVAKGITV
ncbi:MAG: hypothetical protein CMM28_04685 [Rhodospirillaceae bacterium]|nr:hypothetical protein [Rhodospirillaceae bacterium]|tara:strand:- start:135 stop:1547 length:1413 start_codon:yes stop_codon:yes gene_type:complete